jgi:predicted molibdopterin-dependent oxidoreductase YjgC
MRVETDTTRVRRLQKAALELILSTHEVDCGNCPANKKCDLQRIARFLKVGLKPKRLDRRIKEGLPAIEHPALTFYPNRCVLCGKCVHTCRKLHAQPFLTFSGRGFDTTICFYGLESSEAPPCGECTACVDICPVAAILLKNETG